MTAIRQELLVAVFDNATQARMAVEQLRHHGFKERQLGVVGPHADEIQADELDREEVTEHSLVAEGSVTGAVAGAGLGGLCGMAMAAGLLPVIGPVVAGGMLASVLVTAATGAAFGGLAGALVGLGSSEEDAAFFQEELERGKSVVTVQVEEPRANDAMRILHQFGAQLDAAAGS
jgi:hypothetical protein